MNLLSAYRRWALVIDIGRPSERGRFAGARERGHVSRVVGPGGFGTREIVEPVANGEVDLKRIATGSPTHRRSWCSVAGVNGPECEQTGR